jgi:ATP-dependent DNA ligase
VAVDKPDIRAAVGAAAGRNLRRRVRARRARTDLFRQACQFGLEGLVSRSSRTGPYREGRSPHWIKVKNRSHPAIERVKEPFA